MAITCEVIKDMGDTIITIEGIAIGIKITIKEGVGHLKDRIEIGQMTEAQVEVGLGQVLEKVQTEIEFDALNVENMITSHENVQLD